MSFIRLGQRLLQCPFVLNRLITDNVLVAFEINHYIRTKPKSKKDIMTLKLDVSKAYDKVEWKFLRLILLRLGLPHNFVDHIMLFVTSISYSYLFNGFQFGRLVLEKGSLSRGSSLPILVHLCSGGFHSSHYAGGGRGVCSRAQSSSIGTIHFHTVASSSIAGRWRRMPLP